ncbi:MAG: YezD family protein [Gemmatimonadota bacterium]
MTDTRASRPTPASAAVMARIAAALEGLRFGSVEIVVHEGRVVQVERREKVRLTSEPGED